MLFAKCLLYGMSHTAKSVESSFAKSIVFTTPSQCFLGFFGFFGFLKDFRNFPGRMPRPITWHMLLYPRPRSSPRGIPRGGARSEWSTSSGPRAGYSSICHATGLGILPGRFRKSFRNPKNPKIRKNLDMLL